MALPIITPQGINLLIGPLRPFSSSMLQEMFDVTYAGAISWIDRNVGTSNSEYRIVGWSFKGTRYAMIVPADVKIVGGF